MRYGILRIPEKKKIKQYPKIKEKNHGEN